MPLSLSCGCTVNGPAMIPAVSQTLAEILATGIPAISLEQIDLNPPTLKQSVGPKINLYCYDIQGNSQMHAAEWQGEGRNSQDQLTNRSSDRSTWFDVCFLVCAYNGTALGEQHLLSESLKLLLRHRLLREELLAPALRGHGDLSMNVSSVQSIDKVNLWNSLGVPLRPALYVTVQIPFNRQDETFTPPGITVVN